MTRSTHSLLLAALSVIALWMSGTPIAHAAVDGAVTPNPSYAGGALRFTKFLAMGNSCLEAVRVLDVSTLVNEIAIRYTVEPIPPMVCGVPPPLGFDVAIGPLAQGQYSVHAVGDYHGTPLPPTDTPFTVLAAPAPLHTWQGLWWNAPAGSESGWGLSIAHQGDTLFAAWFTYDASGRAWWLALSAQKVAPDTYAGDLYETTGPPYDSRPFPPMGAPNGATATRVGTATLTFTGSSSGTFTYTVGGTTQAKSITRQVFGDVAHDCPFEPVFDVARATNVTDTWWAAPAGSEAGWGIAIDEQARKDGRPLMFATWFTYDRDRRPLWLSTTAEVDYASGTFKGALLRTRGPAFSAMPFPPLGSAGGATITQLGTAEFTIFYDGTIGFASTVNGVTQQRTLTRQVFGTPRAVCTYAAP